MDKEAIRRADPELTRALVGIVESVRNQAIYGSGDQVAIPRAIISEIAALSYATWIAAENGVEPIAPDLQKPAEWNIYQAFRYLRSLTHSNEQLHMLVQRQAEQLSTLREANAALSETLEKYAGAAPAKPGPEARL